MNPQPRRQLISLLRQYGPGLLTDPPRTEALLADLCDQCEREIFVLVHAQRLGVPAELTRLAGQQADSALRQRLARRLQDRYAFSAEAAAWAVDAWADALNVRSVTVYQSWLLAFWHSFTKGIKTLWPAEAGRRPPAYRAAVNRGDNERSFFGRIGVQWKRLSVVSLLLAAVMVGSGIVWQRDWLESGWNLVVGLPGATVEAEWQPPSPASAATALVQRYPPPQEARIEADLLNVRAAPDLNGDVVGKVGPVGATVSVDGFSDDGGWSHITAPVAGWVSNEFVTFAGLYLGAGLGQVIQAGTLVYAQPQRDSPAVETLIAGQILVLVALSADGQWRQVVEPSPGWVESRYIEVMER